MTIANLGLYDDLNMFVAYDLPNVLAGGPCEFSDGLSIAWVFGQTKHPSPGEMEAVAGRIASSSPVLVHTFGPCSEDAHDLVDAALLRRPGNQAITCWTPEYTPAEIIFEFFRTDLPAERDFERWSGRLLLFDSSVMETDRGRLIDYCRDVDSIIARLLDSEEDCGG